MPMNSPSFNRCAGNCDAVENPAEQYLFPENSCDTHFHVFGRSDDFPLIAERAYTPADRKSTRLNSSHLVISYAVFCLKKKKNTLEQILISRITSKSAAY